MTRLIMQATIIIATLHSPLHHTQGQCSVNSVQSYQITLNVGDQFLMLHASKFITVDVQIYRGQGTVSSKVAIYVCLFKCLLHTEIHVGPDGTILKQNAQVYNIETKTVTDYLKNHWTKYRLMPTCTHIDALISADSKYGHAIEEF